MKQQCIAEGDLRAWLDRELEPAGMLAVETHLKDCADCLALSETLSARATMVMSALIDLPVICRAPAPAARPWKIMAGWRWAFWLAPAAALAALLTFVALPRPKPDAGPVAAVAHPPQVETPVAASHPPPVVDAVPHRVPRRAVVPPAVTPVNTASGRSNHFVALDDEPIETGVVVRVGTESGGFQADVIVGPDGRAHAIRVLME